MINSFVPMPPLEARYLREAGCELSPAVWHRLVVQITEIAEVVRVSEQRVKDAPVDTCTLGMIQLTLSDGTSVYVTELINNCFKFSINPSVFNPIGFGFETGALRGLPYNFFFYNAAGQIITKFDGYSNEEIRLLQSFLPERYPALISAIHEAVTEPSIEAMITATRNALGLT